MINGFLDNQPIRTLSIDRCISCIHEINPKGFCKHFIWLCLKKKKKKILDDLKEHLKSRVPDATSIFVLMMWLITAQAIRREKKCSIILFCWCLSSCQKEKIFWRWTPVDLSFDRAHLFTTPTTKQVKCCRFSSAARLSLPPQHQTHLALLPKWNPTHSPWSRFVSATLRPQQDLSLSAVHFNLGYSSAL